MEEPSVVPSENFDVITYTGNSSTQDITGLDFQPDLVWGKNRNSTYDNALNDYVRGITNVLISNKTNAEASINTYNSFNSDGFTLNTGALLNESGKTYVAWNWKAGGTGVSNHRWFYYITL